MYQLQGHTKGQSANMLQISTTFVNYHHECTDRQTDRQTDEIHVHVLYVGLAPISSPLNLHLWINYRVSYDKTNFGNYYCADDCHSYCDQKYTYVEHEAM